MIRFNMWLDLIIFLHSLLYLWVATLYLTSGTRYFYLILLANITAFFGGLYIIDACVSYFWDEEHQGFMKMGFIFYQVGAQTIISFCLALWLNAKTRKSVQKNSILP